jgi:hypothetical protein
VPSSLDLLGHGGVYDLVASLTKLSLKRPDGVSVLFTHILFDVLPENNHRVIVLFHATLRTLDTGLEPGHDAPGMKHVLAFELFIGTFRSLKTDRTDLWGMNHAFPILYGGPLTLGSA